MAILKVDEVNKQANVVNEALLNKDVSATAVGLLSLLLMLEQRTNKVNQNELMQKSGLRRTRFIKARKELEQSGILKVTKIRVKHGFNYEWIIK